MNILGKELASLMGTTCATVEEKYQLLKKRDELLNSLVVKRADATISVSVVRDIHSCSLLIIPLSGNLPRHVSREGAVHAPGAE